MKELYTLLKTRVERLGDELENRTPDLVIRLELKGIEEVLKQMALEIN